MCSKDVRGVLIWNYLQRNVTPEVELQKKPNTVVELSLFVDLGQSDYEKVYGLGFSKCNPHYDKFDSEEGYRIAYKRAMQDILEQILHRKNYESVLRAILTEIK